MSDEDSLLDVINVYTKRHLITHAKFAGSLEKLIMLHDP
jgi:hypothetical protein